MPPQIKVVIPALNEEANVGGVVSSIPKDLVSEVVVVDNGSTDQTAAKAREAGATVVAQPVRGYGNACLKGMEYLRSLPLSEQPDILVFLDADGSDVPAQMQELIAPIVEQDYDMVIGSRALGERAAGSMTPPQLFGNWLASTLLRIIYGHRFTDLGPFRAIKWEELLDLDMRDRDFGWTVEMQVKAVRDGLKCTEIPVDYLKRGGGKSKVSGTIKGTILAGYKILFTIFRYAWSR